ETLGLTPLAFKAIALLGAKNIAELALISQEKLLQTKGLGHGHIEEMKGKLLQFLGHESAKTTTFDLFSFIRILFQSVDPKDRALFLGPFHLAFLYPLKPQDH